MTNIGNVYIADMGNYRIRKVTLITDSNTKSIFTIAGTGTPGYSGDNGAATSATMKTPYGIALDSAGRKPIQVSFVTFKFFALCRQRVYR